MPNHPAVVTEIEELAPSVLQLTIALNDGTFSFAPGQWVNFRFPEGVSRAYTIASAPERPDAIQLCVRVGDGKGGIALKRLANGAAVSIDGIEKILRRAPNTAVLIDEAYYEFCGITALRHWLARDGAFTLSSYDGSPNETV